MTFLSLREQKSNLILRQLLSLIWINNMSIANHLKVYILFAFFFFWRILFTFFSFSFCLLHISSYWNFCISSLILRCWRLFMVKLWNHGLLDASTMNNCSIILESNQNGGSDSGTNWRPSVSSTTIYIQSSLSCICNKLYNIEQCMLLKYWGWGLFLSYVSYCWVGYV